ncbi:hypothetical protein BV898_03411 [Hypsibius exemplaris]|uniref:G-protein coupled receptors family 1 profile domain-containing protein n=1 Tax=Hypsibius exemplaris TaxID=2072580 RepID=A0A1W0X4Z1_HYPEX|nr:hypothetical protein BV898_03411 [Hypsibius exemplaris]
MDKQHNLTSLNHTAIYNSSSFPSFPKLAKAKQAELLAWICVTLIISLVGAFNNIVVLMATIPKRGAKSGLVFLIFHFISVNLFMCLIAIPVSIVLILVKRAGIPLRPDSCIYFQAFYSTGAIVVKWADAGLALNRCVALFLPHRYKGWTTKTTTVGMVLFAWIPSLLAQIPLSFGVGGTLKLQELGQCAAIPKGQLGSFLQTALGTGVPLSLTGLGCVLIVIKVILMCRSRGHMIGPKNGPECKQARRMLRHIKMAKLLLVTFLWTALCNLPWAVVSSNYPSANSENPVSVLWLRTCFVIQYGLTPCILLFGNEEYRARLKQLLCCGGSVLSGSGGTGSAKRTGRATSPMARSVPDRVSGRSTAAVALKGSTAYPATGIPVPVTRLSST